MNLKVSKESENPLLHRKELVVFFESDGPTPKKENVIEKLSAVLNVDKSLVVIDKIHQNFGSRDGIVFIKIYESPDILEKVELKKGLSGEKAKEGKPTGESEPVEKKKEEKQEKPKEEESKQEEAKEKTNEKNPEEKPSKSNESKEEGA